MPVQDNTFGWIYEMVDLVTGMVIYVGSTTCIQSRISSHKNATNCPTARTYNKPMYQFIRANGGFHTVRMHIHWTGPISSRRELHQREQDLINTHSLELLFNKTNPICDRVQYEETNRERSLKYYHDHWGRINRRVACECGSVITYNGRTMHGKTLKHQSYEPIELFPLFE
jgi:hypothetical protein